MVWTDRLTAYEHYQAKATGSTRCPADNDQYIAYIAYDIDLFEEGSIPNLTSSIIGNVFGFKALKALRLEDMRIPLHYLKTFQGPPHGIVMEREYLNKYGRPLLGRHHQAQARPVGRNYGRVVYEALRGGLDFTKDDENINSQPFMRWRDRFLFSMEAVNRAKELTGEIKGHYLNVTAATMEDMYERAEFAKAARQRHHHDRPDRRLHRHDTPCPSGPAANGMLLHLHRAGHGTYTRQKNHGVSFRVISKWVPDDRRRPRPRRHGGGQAGGRPGHDRRGYYDTLRDSTTSRSTRLRASTSTRTGARCRASCRSPRAASTPARCTSCSITSARTSCCSSAAAPSATPWASRPGAEANRVALEAMIKARNEGRDYVARASRSSRSRPRSTRPLQVALDIWGDISFNYESTDTPDVVATPSLLGAAMQITQGTFSYLPDLTDDEITAQVEYCHRQRAGRSRSSSPTTRTRATCCGRCGTCPCSASPTRPRSCSR